TSTSPPAFAEESRYKGYCCSSGEPNNLMRPQHFRLAVFFLIGASSALAQYLQSGGKLVGAGSVAASQGWSVALSADGGTAAVGGPTDGFPSLGSVWFYTRTNGGWTQQGPRMVGTG